MDHEYGCHFSKNLEYMRSLLGIDFTTELNQIMHDPMVLTDIYFSNLYCTCELFAGIILNSKKKYERIFHLDSTAVIKQEYQHTRIANMMLWKISMFFAVVGCQLMASDYYLTG